MLEITGVICCFYLILVQAQRFRVMLWLLETVKPKQWARSLLILLFDLLDDEYHPLWGILNKYDISGGRSTLIIMLIYILFSYPFLILDAAICLPWAIQSSDFFKDLIQDQSYKLFYHLRLGLHSSPILQASQPKLYLYLMFSTRVHFTFSPAFFI
jgi:hypothetical protein